MACSAVIALLPAAALGAVTGVAVTPAAERVALTQPTSLALTWNVTTNTTGSATVASMFGQFRTPLGVLLGTVAQPLSKSVTGPATVAFAETLRVPVGVLEGARRKGHDHVVYRRSFTDGAAASGDVKLFMVTTKGATFGVSRIALRFDGGETARVVARGEEVHVQAALSYTGLGFMRARWEIAGPNPDADEPVWRVLTDVSRALVSGDTVTLASPALPTNDAGFYLVRLRVSEPWPAFDLPVARYSVQRE